MSNNSNKKSLYASQKLVVDAFKKDGAICNSLKKEYNEQATFEGGTGNRKIFTVYNNMINRYHKILKSLTGEQRANISETIPAIDFLRPENTSLMYTYPLKNGYNNKIDPTTIVALEDSKEKSAIDYILEEDSSILNRAVTPENEMALQFYNTTSGIGSIPDIQVSPYKGDMSWKYKGVLAKPVRDSEGTVFNSLKTPSIFCYKVNLKTLNISLEINFNNENFLKNETPLIYKSGDSIEATCTEINNMPFMAKSKDSNSVWTLTLLENDICVVLPSVSYSTDPSIILIFKYDESIKGNEQAEESGSNKEALQPSYRVFASTFIDFTPSANLQEIPVNGNLPDYLYSNFFYNHLIKFLDIKKEYYSDASGLLSGYYSKPYIVTDSLMGKTVEKWVFEEESDLAFSKGIKIDIGSRYFPGHILNRGIFINEPLKLTANDYKNHPHNIHINIESNEPDYITTDKGNGKIQGKATLLYDMLADKISCLFDKIKIPEWNISKNLYPNVPIYRLGCITRKQDYCGVELTPSEKKSYLGETSKNKGQSLIYPDKFKTSKLNGNKKISYKEIQEYINECVNTAGSLTGESFPDTLYLSTDNESNSYTISEARNSTVLFDSWFQNEKITQDTGNLIHSKYNNIYYMKFSRYYKKKWEKWFKRVDYLEDGCSNLKVQVSSPINAFAKKLSNNEHPDIILLYPEYNNTLPEELYLFSRKDLGLREYGEEIKNPNNPDTGHIQPGGMVSFYDDSHEQVISFKVAKKVEFKPSAIKKAVVYDSFTGNSYTRDCTITNSKDSDCYIYVLNAMDLSLSGLKFYDINNNQKDLSEGISDITINPLAYPPTFFKSNIIRNPSNPEDLIIRVDPSAREESLNNLQNSLIIPDLPSFKEASELDQYYIGTSSEGKVSLHIFRDLIEKGIGNIAKKIIREGIYKILADWPITDSSINPINLGSTSKVAQGLVDLKEPLINLNEAGFKIYMPVKKDIYDKDSNGNIIKDPLTNLPIVKNTEYKNELHTLKDVDIMGLLNRIDSSDKFTVYDYNVYLRDPQISDYSYDSFKKNWQKFYNPKYMPDWPIYSNMSDSDFQLFKEDALKDTYEKIEERVEADASISPDKKEEEKLRLKKDALNIKTIFLDKNKKEFKIEFNEPTIIYEENHMHSIPGLGLPYPEKINSYKTLIQNIKKSDTLVHSGVWSCNWSADISQEFLVQIEKNPIDDNSLFTINANNRLLKTDSADLNNYPQLLAENISKRLITKRFLVGKNSRPSLQDVSLAMQEVFEENGNLTRESCERIDNYFGNGAPPLIKFGNPLEAESNAIPSSLSNLNDDIAQYISHMIAFCDNSIKLNIEKNQREEYKLTLKTEMEEESVVNQYNSLYPAWISKKNVKQQEFLKGCRELLTADNQINVNSSLARSFIKEVSSIFRWDFGIFFWRLSTDFIIDKYYIGKSQWDIPWYAFKVRILHNKIEKKVRSKISKYSREREFIYKKEMPQWLQENPQPSKENLARESLIKKGVIEPKPLKRINEDQIDAYLLEYLPGRIFFGIPNTLNKNLPVTYSVNFNLPKIHNEDVGTENEKVIIEPSGNYLTLYDDELPLDSYITKKGDWTVEIEKPDVALTTLQGIADFIHTSLEGTDPENKAGYYVSRTSKDKKVTGRPRSLYYKRYNALNARMNLLEGTLINASRYLEGIKVSEKLNEIHNETSKGYADVIEAIPVEKMEGLEYMPAQEATGTTIPIPGKFYSTAEMNYLKNQINDKCILTCTRCSVKNSCPFYNEQELLKLYCSPVQSIDLWFKDNELDLLEYDNSIEDRSPNLIYEFKDNDGKIFKETLPLETFKNIHLSFSDILKKENHNKEVSKSEDYYNLRDLESLRESLKLSSSDLNYDPNRDDLGWLLGGRYGTVEKNKIGDLLENNAEIPLNIPKYKFLYNALFIPDEESHICYSRSTTKYDVEVSLGPSDNKKIYKGNTYIKIPETLDILLRADPSDEVYLVSDDTLDDHGQPISPVIYLGQKNSLRYAFDLADDGNQDGCLSTLKTNHLYAKDVAQGCVNIVKGAMIDDPIGTHLEDNEDRDQYWMENIYKSYIVNDKKYWLKLKGRERMAAHYQEPVIDPDNIDEALLISGKPPIINYMNFIRKFSIRIYEPDDNNPGEGTWLIPWVNSRICSPDDPNYEKICEQKRMILPLMKTNLRFVVVKAK